MHVTFPYFQPLRVQAFGQNSFIMTNKNKCVHRVSFFFFSFSVSESFPSEKTKGLSSQSKSGILRLTCLSQKTENTSLSEVIAAKINSLQAVGISMDNKLDGLDARVAMLGSPDGNTDQNTLWLEGIVKNTGIGGLCLLFLQYHQRHRGLWALEGEYRQANRIIAVGATCLFSP